MSSILLSERHGVNPAVEQCFVCMKDVGVALFGRLRGDRRAPHRVCLSAEPCDECKRFMEMGIILISVDEKKTNDPNNPWRTGGWAVVREGVVKRMVRPKELADQIIAKRMAFVPDDAWDKLGLPRAGAPGEEQL